MPGLPALLAMLVLIPAASLQAAPTWFGEVKNIIDTRCGGCHAPDNIGPFPLKSYEQVHPLRNIISDSVRQGRMPPWHPADGCNEYKHDLSLTEAEKQTLYDWAGAGGPLGDEATHIPATNTYVAPRFNKSVPMKEAYAPTRENTDDYRCFVMDPKTTEDMFINGLFLDVDRRDLVHHMLAYVVEPEYADMARGWEDEDEGPGYSCWGLPSRSIQAGNRRIGAWVPGMMPYIMEGDTGYKFRAGSVVLMQIHYNTLTADPGKGDRSTLKLNLVPTVSRPVADAFYLNPLWLLGNFMRIPAGEPHVEHSFSSDYSNGMLALEGETVGLRRGDSFEVFGVHIHMHQLGSGGRIDLIRADGTEQCLLDIRNYEFYWQTGYLLKESVIVHPGDRIKVTCEWDNSAGNQPVVNGRRLEPRDVAWGEGTRDEMCLGGFLYKAPGG